MEKIKELEILEKEAKAFLETLINEIEIKLHWLLWIWEMATVKGEGKEIVLIEDEEWKYSLYPGCQAILKTHKPDDLDYSLDPEREDLELLVKILKKIPEQVKTYIESLKTPERR